MERLRVGIVSLYFHPDMSGTSYVLTDLAVGLTRMGCEVIRGHLSTLLVDGEVLYLEPVFIRSQQNAVTQLKQVAVVLRGKAAMAGTLADALREVCAKLKRDT